MSRRPHELSGGERQRVALARALAREPAVLLLDEPFAAVDRSIRRRMQSEIDALRRTLDMPLVLVTHDFDDVVRLATHVLLLESGRTIAWGAVPVLMSRPDLTWLREAVGLGSVFEGVVAGTDAGRGLLALAFEGGTLLAPNRDVAVGARVRVRIPAREVIMSTKAPDGLSLHNVLSGTVTAVHAAAPTDQVTVQIAVGGVLLLAEVTRDAIARLHIAPGSRVHALIKSVSIEIQN
jgi:molybdate transport system ATP-binding protein